MWSAVLAFALIGQSTPKVRPGVAPPKLSNLTWIQGEPVAELDQTKTYVLEFWATWCEPCITTIPHLNELATKFPEATFVGLSIEDHQDGKVKRFVEKMGQSMTYRVATTGTNGSMLNAWLESSRQNSIPTTFVVQGGIIRWIGHPSQLEKVLSDLRAGTHDMAAAERSFYANLGPDPELSRIQSQLESIELLYDTGQKIEAQKQLHGLISQVPQAEPMSRWLTLKWTALEKPDQIRDFERPISGSVSAGLTKVARMRAGKPAIKTFVDWLTMAPNATVDELYLCVRLLALTGDVGRKKQIALQALELLDRQGSTSDSRIRKILIRESGG